MSRLIRDAESVARLAHAGQVDKSGAAYVEHPRRVAERVAGRASDEVREVAVCAAWLHDVVEDTGVTLDGVRDGFGIEVATVVDALTKRGGESRDDYFARVLDAGPVAVMVKTADLDDNTSEERVALLDPATRDRLARKYEHARAALAPQG